MKNIKLKKVGIAVATACLGLVVSAAQAAPLIPFSNGNVADANDVNTNFTELETRINTISLTPGADGTNGLDGADGSNGTNGLAGADGSNGTNGLAGADGSNGTNGLAGADGSNGTDGTDGVGISSIVDDGAGSLTITLTDTSTNVLPIPATATYSYRDFGHTYGKKTFAVTDSRLKYDTEIRTFDRISVPGQVSYTRDRRTDGGTIAFRYHTITVDNSGSELLFKVLTTHDATATDPSTVITETKTITPGLISRTESMELGKVYGSDVTVASDINVDAFVVQTSALIAVNQSVSVAGGSFSGCIKISRHRSGNTLGETHQQISTFCPNVGLVKQIFSKVFYDASPEIRTHTTVKELSTCDNNLCNPPA